MREKTRVEAVRAVMDGRLTVVEAATALNLSERQLYRSLAAAKEQGLVRLVHGNRGRTPWNKSDERCGRACCGSCKSATRMSTTVTFRSCLSVSTPSKSTLRRCAGTCAPQASRPSAPAAHVSSASGASAGPPPGILLQVDASRHGWLEGRGLHLTLVGAKDDAMGEVWSYFCEAESCWAYLGLMRAICLSAGVPLALYSDHQTIFHSPRADRHQPDRQPAPLTQFGRAMEGLGVSIIKAYSPQAKGRIERQWGVF